MYVIERSDACDSLSNFAVTIGGPLSVAYVCDDQASIQWGLVLEFLNYLESFLYAYDVQNTARQRTDTVVG